MVDAPTTKGMEKNKKMPPNFLGPKHISTQRNDILLVDQSKWEDSLQSFPRLAAAYRAHIL